MRETTDQFTADFKKHLAEAVLIHHRHILDAIHAGGNIYYDKSRLEAYAIIAKIASGIRTEALCSGRK